MGPKGVTVSSTGELIVVDNKGSCVYILQPSGKVLAKFGSRGSELDQFAGPHYAAVNSAGNIVISDFHNHNIKVSQVSNSHLAPHTLTLQIFSKEGHFIFSFGSNGNIYDFKP